jgi:hypothetical protein
MDFTFGIITTCDSINSVADIILSIKKLNIPKYEIIVVGGNKIDDVIHVPFDETVKPMWITKKKNIICKMAQYENIVLIHDYINFNEDWYSGFLKFGNDFNICVSKILNKDKTRFRDYTIYPSNTPFTQRALIPYDYPSSLRLSYISYISGSYYIIKKDIALKFQLDERLCWGDGEDILLIKQLLHNNITIKCNKYSTVKFQKQKMPEVWEVEMTNEDITLFENLSDIELYNINLLQCNDYKNHIIQKRGIHI